MLIAQIVMFILEAYGLWGLLPLFDQPSWKAVVPIIKEHAIYSGVWNEFGFLCMMTSNVLGNIIYYVMGIDSQIYLILLTILLVVTYVFKFVFSKKLANWFGKSTGFAILAFILPFVAYLILRKESQDVK